MGWFRMEAATWPLVAEALLATAEPWDEALCLADLRWHWDQKQRLPGRPALVKRWRLTDRVVRRLMADPRWWDEHWGEHAFSVQPVSNDRPTGVQLVSNDRPAVARANARNGAEMSSDRPARVQRVSNDRPTHVLTRGVHTTPSPAQPPPPEEDAAPPARRTKAKPVKDSPLADPKVRALGDAWQATWTAKRGVPYVWGSWPRAANTLAAFASVQPATFAAAVDRYLEAEAGSGVWPKDKPPSIAKFAQGSDGWLNGAALDPIARWGSNPHDDGHYVMTPEEEARADAIFAANAAARRDADA